MMTLDEALHYIHAVCWKGSIPGLERITALLTACLKNEVLFRYFDLWTGAEKTITAHPMVDTVSVLLDDSGTHWWRGFRVTMRAK